jgi:AbrB family looped-hinge helix DNA binding protein
MEPTNTKVSSKGQVVIPKSVRDALGIGVGTVLNAEAHDGVVVLRPVRDEKRLPTREELDKVAGSLARPGALPTRAEEEQAVADMFRREWRSN